MTTQKAVVWMFAMVLITLAILFGLAIKGSVLSIVTLAVLTTMFLMLTGASIAIYVNNSRAKIEADRFTENIKENLALMQSMQSIQNKQNSTIMQQLGQAARLPQLPENGQRSLDDIILDSDMFAEID